MSKRDELIAIYAGDLREKCGVTPDMDLLTKVTIGLGGYAGITKDDEGFGVTAGGKMSTTLFF